MTIEFIIAGLGNPGSEYRYTRHNAGFLALDYMSRVFGTEIKKLKFKSLYGECIISGKRVLLLKPQTYMNGSGEAVLAAADYYKIPMDKVLIIYDDVSLPLGKLRIRERGSDGGHKGIRDIIRVSNTDEFPRIKIGVDSPPPERIIVDWVLSSFTSGELSVISDSFKLVKEAVDFIVSGDVNRAMNLYN